MNEKESVMRKKWMKWGLLAVMSTTVLAACQSQPKNEADTVSGASIKTPREIIKSPVKKTDFLLGTAVSLSVYHPNSEALIESALEMIKDLEKRITVNASGSEVDEVNIAAGEKPVKVSADVYELIKLGLEYSAEFNGAFDITVGPLTSLWHIGFDDAKKPTQEEIDAVLPLVDYKEVELNDAEQTVFLKKKGMKLDLGGIAKGYIADKVWDYFAKEGVTTAVIDLGGNIVFQGSTELLSKQSANKLIADYPHSYTIKYLTHAETIAVPASRRSWNQSIVLKGARMNNLKGILWYRNVGSLR